MLQKKHKQMIIIHALESLKESKVMHKMDTN